MARALLGVLLTLTLAGCKTGPDPIDPSELQVVRAKPVDEAPLPPRFELVITAKAATDVETSPSSLDLWIPLPPDNEYQHVLTLLGEVEKPAIIEGTTTDADGQRMLHVRSPGGFPDVSLRALVEIRKLDPGRAGPPQPNLRSTEGRAESQGQPIPVVLDYDVREAPAER